MFVCVCVLLYVFYRLVVFIRVCEFFFNLGVEWCGVGWGGGWGIYMVFFNGGVCESLVFVCVCVYVLCLWCGFVG